MKVTIEIGRDEELEKIGKVLKGENITVVKTRRGRKEIGNYTLGKATLM